MIKEFKNDLGDLTRLEDLRRLSTVATTPSDVDRLTRAYSRSKATGQRLAHMPIFSDKIFNEKFRATTEERGQREKERIIRRLKEAGISENEGLVLKSTPNVDFDRKTGNAMWTQRIVLWSTGIDVHTYMRISTGTGSIGFESRRIKTEEYPKYTDLANQRIDEEIAINQAQQGTGQKPI